MMGMFVIGSLIQRWVSITLIPVVSTVKQQEGAYIDWDKLPKGFAGVKETFHQQAAGRSLDANKVTTLQDQEPIDSWSCCPWFDFPLYVPS